MPSWPIPTDPISPYLRRILGGGGSNRIGSSVGSGAANFGIGFLSPTAPTSSNVGKQGSSLDELFKQLLSSAAGGYSLPSQQSLEMQARTEADMAYNPQIAALRRAMSQAKSNAGYSKAAVGKLFQGLASSYEEDKKATKALFKSSKENEKALYKEYSDNVKDNYKESMDSLAETYKKLGIEAAAGESTTGKLAQEEAFNLQQEATKSTAEQRALSQEQTGEMKYWQEGIGTAKMEGTQRQSDIDMALNALLNEKSGQIADLEAQRQLAYQNMIAKLQASVAEQAAKQSQQTWSNLMELARFQQSQQRSASSSAGFGKGLTGANKYLYEQFVNSQWGPSEAERYSGILQGIILNLPPGMSAEQAAQYAAQEARRRGISETVMARAMLAYQGRL